MDSVERSKNCLILMLLLGFAVPSAVWAKSSKKTHINKNTPHSKTTTINFADQLVQGEVKKPELFYLLQRRQFNYKRLIKLRENFIPEMKKSAEDVGGAGSGN